MAHMCPHTHITHINNNDDDNNSKKHRPDRAGPCCGPGACHTPTPILGLIVPISAYSVKGSIVLSHPRVSADESRRRQCEGLSVGMPGHRESEVSRAWLGGLGWRQRVKEETSTVVR